MKALTLWQPWASLIAAGIKTIETRSWPTEHRGPLAIHAAKRPMTDEVSMRLYWDNAEELVQHEDLATWDTLPFGKVVATCTLVDVVPTERVGFVGAEDPWVIAKGWHRCRGDFDYTARRAQEPMGDYTPGRFAWILDEVKVLHTPLAVRGGQRLWTWRVVP